MHTSEVIWLVIDIWATSHDLDPVRDLCRVHGLFLDLSLDRDLDPYLYPDLCLLMERALAIDYANMT